MQEITMGLDALSQILASFKSASKPKMLVVDDEPDNLDLLYRTFRRDFRVLKAENGMSALNVLEQEGEVAVIISDQRMPEMKGTEFLSRTVPQYPYTMRIILTGFTDVEDLVEAINSGQVYKYITKPWDREEMQQVVDRAVATYQLSKQQAEELERAHAQSLLLKSLVDITRKSNQFQAFLDATTSAMRSGFEADGCLLALVDEQHITSTRGLSGTTDHLSALLSDAEFVAQAIAHHDMQGLLRSPSELPLPNVDVQSYLAAPLVSQGNLKALLLLGWRESCPLESDDLHILYFTAQQIALTLGSVPCMAG
ncbi:MAG: response regulator [Synechococcales cyanobacterium T60_A2020_003]|nr:response regulator [Synechococcales cyanobacterium T60_A2020_003]